MSSQTIRPSTKTVKLGYVLVLLLVIAAFVIYSQVNVDGPPWVPALALLAFLLPLRAHLGRMMTKLTLEGERLRYEAGFLSKSTRLIELRKVQDVRVDQSVGQRILSTGNLSIETAGESSRLVMPDIDNPHRVAEVILQAARHDQHP